MRGGDSPAFSSGTCNTQPPPKVRCRLLPLRRLPPFSLHSVRDRKILAPAMAVAIATTADGCSPIGKCCEGPPLEERREKGSGGRGGRRMAASENFERIPCLSVFICLTDSDNCERISQRDLQCLWRRMETLRAAQRGWTIGWRKDFQTAFSATETGWGGMGWIGEREEREAGISGETRTEETEQKST